jgi:hypothetical protein
LKKIQKNSKKYGSWEAKNLAAKNKSSTLANQGAAE